MYYKSHEVKYMFVRSHLSIDICWTTQKLPLQYMYIFLQDVNLTCFQCIDEYLSNIEIRTSLHARYTTL